ncbi:MAG TPA: ankyrin repeat domain-containing protein, partial [Amoebophilaceae bacterium]|nr:ankyrin repeat domain-containing protein [Amoebophilaceae bacterium]
ALKAFIQTQEKWGGYTALHLAAEKGHAEVIPALLKPFEGDPAALKAFIQTQNKDGWTALHLAAEKGRAEFIPALLKPFEGDPAALKEFIQTKNNEGKTALDKANGKDNVAKILSSYVRQKREISKASEEEVEELVDPKAFPSLIKDSVATATDHAEIPELSPTAASYQKQLLLEAIAPAEGFVASSAARPTPTTWLGDLWVWGKKLVVGSYSKPVSLDPLGGPLSSKPAVCSDQLHIGARPIGPTAGPTLLEMGDQWVKNSDTNGLLTWGSLLARKWTGSRPKAFQTPSYDPAIDVALSIRSHEWVDAFMAKVEEQAQACGIAKATSSAIVGSAELYTKAIETVRKKIAAGQEEGITASLFEQVVQQNSRKIAAKTTPKQTEQWLANVREALPKLKQQFLQQAAPLQNPCQAAARANTTSKPNISLLKQAMCSMQPTSQLADATNTLCMGNTHNVGDVLIQNGIEDRGQYRKCGNL